MSLNLTHQKTIGKYIDKYLILLIKYNEINNLETYLAFKINSFFLDKNRRKMVGNEIRSATLPELFHNRRLDEIEQSIAEVS